jgi:predicted small lipoprotein YifL
VRKPLHACVRIALTLLPLTACGQQAIVNMPSADITPAGKNFYMHESQWRQWNPGRYWLGTNFYCRGVGHATELTATNWNAGSPAVPNVATGVGFKSSPQFFAERYPNEEIKVTVGQKLVMNHRAQGLGSFSYSHLSFRIPSLKTRLTAGAWAGTRQLFKRNTANVLAGLEHPFDSKGKYVWVNEWFRGRHDFGFYITGLLYHPTKRHIVVVAYKVANTPANGKNGVVLEYGIFF